MKHRRDRHVESSAREKRVPGIPATSTAQPQKGEWRHDWPVACNRPRLGCPSWPFVYNVVAGYVTRRNQESRSLVIWRRKPASYAATNDDGCQVCCVGLSDINDQPFDLRQLGLSPAPVQSEIRTPNEVSSKRGASREGPAA